MFFLSSVGIVLRDCRERAYKAVEGLDGYHCIRMEDFGAHDEVPQELCEAKVKECDLLLCLAGPDYGSCPSGTEISFTELEYDAAMAANKPCIILLSHEMFAIPWKLIEPDELRQKQIRFRNRLQSEHVVKVFESAESVGTDVGQAIYNFDQNTTGRFVNRPVPTTTLLFPFVTCTESWDTGLQIANVSATPKYPTGLGWVCTIFIFPRAQHSASSEVDAEGKIIFEPNGQPRLKVDPLPYPNEVVITCHGGQVFTSQLSSLVGKQFSKGYLIAECGFHARGYASVTSSKLLYLSGSISYTAELLAADYFAQMNEWISSQILGPAM